MRSAVNTCSMKKRFLINRWLQLKKLINNMGESKWPCNDIPRFVTVVRKGQDILTIRQQPLSVIRINRVVRCRGFTYHVRVELWIRCDDVMWQTGTSQNRQQQMLVDRSTGMVEQNGGCVLEKHRSSSM